VVTCDLMMPHLDGVGFIRQQMARRPVPVLILSVANEEAELVLQALDAGAVDFIQKPTALANDNLFRIREELLEKVKAASQAPAERLRPPAPVVAQTQPTHATASRYDAIVIGVSTGGPQALRILLPQLAADFPVPIAVVLHMPIGFTALYAAKLDEVCSIRVKEAAQGDEMRPGTAVVGMAGRHLVLRRDSLGRVTTHLAIQPVDALHRPSADVLFESAAQVYRERVLGVIMTGMGSDGKEGAAWIKSQGGTVLTEAEESCVIYGMPRSVVEAGLSDAAVPLEKLAQAIIDRL
jgi:two-component system, chemotaxis family, protein-glutamate methylesterase/glutaminase